MLKAESLYSGLLSLTFNSIQKDFHVLASILLCYNICASVVPAVFLIELVCKRAGGFLSDPEMSDCL